MMEMDVLHFRLLRLVGYVREVTCIIKNAISVMRSAGMGLTCISMNVMMETPIIMMDAMISVKLRMDGNVQGGLRLLPILAGN